MKLIAAGSGIELAANVIQASSFFRRLRGLMLTRSLPAGSCLHLKPCSRIHTFFMNYAIDVLYLDKSHTVVGIEQEVQPGRIGKCVPGTASVIEFPSGTLRSKPIMVGHTVLLSAGTKIERGNLYDEHVKSIN